ncbi:MAG TPA: DUF1294 domain-containing protein [Bacillus sp. (in: firmicutes)]|nr:DUF1294 domain-containing protein [Bacillus sp. (in: firmicutes)]
MKDFLLIYYLCVNIAGIMLMAVDKNRAKNRQWRIKESTIWLCSLAGGAMGSTLGMYMFRHKTKHLQFKIGLPLIAIIHVFLLFTSL